MKNILIVVGQAALVAASFIFIGVVALDTARGADHSNATPMNTTTYNDCLYERMIVAATYTALDDAEREGLPSEVVQNLSVDLETAVEMQRLICGVVK